MTKFEISSYFDPHFRFFSRWIFSWIQLLLSNLMSFIRLRKDLVDTKHISRDRNYHDFAKWRNCHFLSREIRYLQANGFLHVIENNFLVTLYVSLFPYRSRIFFNVSILNVKIWNFIIFYFFLEYGVQIRKSVSYKD